jgi:predicted ATPase
VPRLNGPVPGIDLVEETDVSRYVLTGTPGSGKTAILRLLEHAGYRVVEEAATDVIALGQALGRAEPWQGPDFADAIVSLQRRRQDRAESDCGGADGVFFDRSPVCTLALSRYLGWPVSPRLAAEVNRFVLDRATTVVFFVRNQGFVEPTAARRITYEDSLVFEDVHERTYRELGFELIDVPAGPLTQRADLVRAAAGGDPARGDNITRRWDNPGDVSSIDGRAG